jgi:hypothetical protein
MKRSCRRASGRRIIGRNPHRRASARAIQEISVRSKWLALVAVAVVTAAVGWDLWGPRRASLRDFDPNTVAQLETRMWRAYYERREGPLFRDMARLLRTQYHLPWLRSHSAAYQAARAAFVFKRGRVRADYEKALPQLRRYYAAIRKVSDTPFDVERVARLELEWWIVHRQRELHTPAELEAALAQLQAALYAMPAERFAEHARARGEAMSLRDSSAEHGGVSAADWQRIETLLRDAWGALSRAVRA